MTPRTKASLATFAVASVIIGTFILFWFVPEVLVYVMMTIYAAILAALAILVVGLTYGLFENYFDSKQEE